ncbi:Yae1 family protein [Butyrivibrio sp. M55]|uniref:Yae1 family protein n=1 Tax=Butyrivibrio sp. M55 TaxID=1855323 RepID=UPI0008E94326|nr:Yae1 family protein [Butyrivibrio sp. M55]SFU79403.1 Essential protein Yae1, N terminal [Butyrivibrio sp. M55]
MKKRNLGFTWNFIKIIGVAMVASLLLSVNVHAEEVEDLVDSEDITSISDGIDTLDDKVDTLNDNCSDDELSQDISDISAEIDALNEMVSNLNKKYTNLLLTINKNKLSIIKGLNKSAYANDNISESASYSDVISKINDIKYQGTLDLSLDSGDKYTLESGYYDGGTIDVSALIEAARQEGIKEGKEEGLKEGRDEGYKAGKEDGIKEGRAEGDNAGYSRGLADGQKQGIEAGRQQAVNENKQAWIDQGYNSAMNSTRSFYAHMATTVRGWTEHGGVQDCNVTTNVTVSFFGDRNLVHIASDNRNPKDGYYIDLWVRP